jgi:hypothetical protein
MTPIPAEVDTGPPMARKRSPLQPGRPEGAKQLDERLKSCLRHRRKFCKPYRDRLLATLVTELEGRIASIILAESLLRQRQILVCALHALVVAKHRASRRRRRERRHP